MDWLVVELEFELILLGLVFDSYESARTSVITDTFPRFTATSWPCDELTNLLDNSQTNQLTVSQVANWSTHKLINSLTASFFQITDRL